MKELCVLSQKIKAEIQIWKISSVKLALFQCHIWCEPGHLCHCSFWSFIAKLFTVHSLNTDLENSGKTTLEKVERIVFLITN